MDAVQTYEIHHHIVRTNQDSKGRQTFDLLRMNGDEILLTSDVPSEVHRLASALNAVQQAVSLASDPKKHCDLISKCLDGCMGKAGQETKGQKEPAANGTAD